MGGTHEVYTNWKQRRKFTYANVRRATYRGSKTIVNIPNILTLNMISSVFKIWIYVGVCLAQFADSLLFDMMLKTAYLDGVDTPQDLIDRDMSLGTYNRELKSVSKLIFSYLAISSVDSGRYENLRLRTLQNTRNNIEM